MIRGINHITIAVRKLSDSFNFYKDILEFQLLMKSSKIAYFLAGDLWFCLDEDSQTRKSPLPEYTHFAFSVTQEDFVNVASRIKASGAKIWKENESEGQSLYFLDPNGHKLKIHVGNWQTRLESAKQNPWKDGMEFFV
jgi:catechol 2,3-dioxygenase-like lactoylglutathione lyase family enzyme